MTQRSLQELSFEECFTLLSQEVVGRLVYVDDHGPVALPVNYALDSETIVFRIEAGSKARALQGPVAFEVDQIDHAERSGWSVLVRGTCHEVDIEQVPALLHRITSHFPRPWAAGQHNSWVSLVPASVTGRQLAAPFFAPVI